MPLILGLDLGTNSIGWALINDTDHQIVATGSRIFPEGVNRDNLGKEIKKNEQRRLKRQARRQLFRRKFRKWKLAEFLQQHNLFPPVADIRKAITENDPALQSFFSIDPIQCRSRAVTGEKLSLLELGRIFYHFAQRRGYKESLKNEDADTGTLYEGDLDHAKTGINETSALVAEFSTLGNALAQVNPYISSDPHNRRWRNRYTTRLMYTSEFEKIWKAQAVHYPELLTPELKNKIGHATEGLLFFQLPLRSQAHLVGRCTLEPGKTRSNDSCVAFELRRTWEFINTIRIDGDPLNNVQREAIKELFFSKEKCVLTELAKKLKIAANRFNYEEDKIITGTRTISTLRKITGAAKWDKMSLAEQEAIVNIKRFAEDKEKTAAYLQQKYGWDEKQITRFLKLRLTTGYSSLSYKATLNILPFLENGHLYHEAVWLGGIRNAFGSYWEQLDKNQQDYIVTNALEIYNNPDFDSLTTTRNWLKEEFKLPEDRLARLYHHSIDQLKADGNASELPVPPEIKNPVVTQALFEVQKLVNTIIATYGKPAQVRVELSRELKSSLADREQQRLNQFQNERENMIVKSLLDELDLPHTQTNIVKYRLYREIEKKNGHVVCPYSGKEITPRQLFHTKEFEVEHIIPYSVFPDDSLGNKTLCDAAINARKANRTPYDFFKKEFGDEKWEEIKQAALRLLPYHKWLRFIDERPRSLEDFEARKLNDSRYISREAKRYLEHICADVRVTQGELTAKLRHYWGLDNILNPPVAAPDLEDGCEYYIAIDESRQLLEAIPWQPDAKKNREAEKKLAKKGKVLQGNTRKGRFYGYKERDDHRHHAVDALAIACTKTSYLQAVSTMKGRARSREDFEAREINFPEPWPGFIQQATAAISHILTSHKKRSRTLTRVSKFVPVKNEKGAAKSTRKVKVNGIAIRGPLHAETVYGKHEDLSGKTYFHTRKSLQQVSSRAQVDKIADPAVKAAVEQAIIRRWEELDESIIPRHIAAGLLETHGKGYRFTGSKIKYEVPEGAFFEIVRNAENKKTAILPRVFLPIRLHQKPAQEKEELLKRYPEGKVPVLRVRIREQSTGAVQLKDKRNQWVEPDNNYGVLIYENQQGELAEYVVTFWEAVERKKQGVPVFQLPPGGVRVVATLQMNDLFLLHAADAPPAANEQERYFHQLYRVQKLSSLYYVFRKANAATLEFDAEMIRIVSFRAWNNYNPVKVYLDVLGTIRKVPGNR